MYIICIYKCSNPHLEDDQVEAYVNLLHKPPEHKKNRNIF